MLGRKRVNEALASWGEMFPNAHGELEWETPFQLLVAVILSAQTTDKAVNKRLHQACGRVIQKLRIWPPTWMMLRCVCERLVYTRIKQKNIIKTARAVLMNFDGQVPKNA